MILLGGLSVREEVVWVEILLEMSEVEEGLLRRLVVGEEEGR